MKNISGIIAFSILLLISFACIKCTGQQSVPSPKGYDLKKPVKYLMPDDLVEISGITFNNGDASTIFAEQDENGELFYFKPGDKNIRHTKFGKHGDYEDVAISNGQVVMLRSDGMLFTFPLTELKNTETDKVKQQGNLLPQGEYEGLYADNPGNSIYILCKHCSVDKTSKSNTVFNLKIAADGSITKIGQSAIDVKAVEKLSGSKKIDFHPSGLSKNPLTNEWYILSSVNKLLVITDVNWTVKEVYRLDPGIFRQPEGITFDKGGNLYISNESDKISPGNILKFAYKK